MIDLADIIIDGNYQQLKHAVEMGMDVNEIDKYGYTPLIETAIMRKTTMAKLLLSHGAIIDEMDMAGRTALHWAVDTNNLRLATLLLEAGADPNSYGFSGEPVLVNPILRKQNRLKQLLYEFGGNLNFAQDFISHKLLAHRFALKGNGEIITHKNQAIQINYEGFFPEFTLELIADSLSRFKHNYGGRHLRAFFKSLDYVIDALRIASSLTHYKHFTYDIDRQMPQLAPLFKTEPLIIPIGYEGHAVAFIKLGDYFAKCDRGEAGKRFGTVTIYKIGNPRAFNKKFLKFIMYERQKKFFIEEGVNDLLSLEKFASLPLSLQVAGNCSWANVEAVIPTLLFMLWLYHDQKPSEKEINHYADAAMFFFEEWQEWDQDRALDNILHSYESANKARRFTKVSILCAILFQHLDYTNAKDLRRAEKIIPYIIQPEHEFFLRTYIKLYHKRYHTDKGKKLMHLLELAGARFEDDNDLLN